MDVKMKIGRDCAISRVIEPTTCVVLWKSPNFSWMGRSRLSCKNKCFCLKAINAGRRGIWSIGSPLLLALEEAQEGGEDGFPQPWKSLCAFVGSSDTQELSVWINKPRSAHLRDLWVQPQVLASSHWEVRRACCFPGERWRDHSSAMQQGSLRSWTRGVKSDVFQAQDKQWKISLHKEHQKNARRFVSE